MMVKVLMFCLVFMWISEESGSHLYGNAQFVEIQPLCKRELGGVCVISGESCPGQLSQETALGAPFCRSRRRRCCYTAPTTTTTTYTAEDPYCQNFNIEVIGEKRFVFFNCSKTFLQARNSCYYCGLSLATPDEQFDQFNEVMPGGAECWVNVQPDTTDPGVWFWQTSPIKKTTPDQWQNGIIQSAPPNCASIYKDWALNNFNCSQESYYVCEMNHTIHHRKHVKNLHFPPRAGPGRHL